MTDRIEIRFGDRWITAVVQSLPDADGLFAAEDPELWNKWQLHTSWRGLVWREVAV